MLHINFRVNRPAGSGEEDFSIIFTIYGGHLGHVINIISNNFYFHVPKCLHTKFD